MKKRIGTLKVIGYNLFGLALVAAATPAFGFQAGQLAGTPIDNIIHTVAYYCAGPVVAGGSLIALGTGGVLHAATHGEHGRNWLIGGVVGLGIAATAKYVPPMLGVSF